MIHHSASQPRHGGEGDQFDVIETGDGIKIIHRGNDEETGFATADEAEKRADELADEFDNAFNRDRTTYRDGVAYVRADKVVEGDRLDLEGDRYADEDRWLANENGLADQYIPDGDSALLEFELCEVVEVTVENTANGSAIVIETQNGTWGFPPDHELQLSLD